MANSSEILENILQSPPEAPDPIVYQFLVPNQKGLDNFFSIYNKPRSTQRIETDNRPALNTSSQDPNEIRSSTSAQDPIPTKGSNLCRPEIELSIFTAATETFTQKNTNCSIAESLERFKPIFATGLDSNLRVRAYISVALGCPYEGPDVDPKLVADIAVTLLEMGADEISVADTTGMGTAPKTRELLKTLAAAGVDTQDLALHFHDTYGQALVNTVVGLEAGVRTFDAAVAGLGGCPYSPGATGNVATEDLVYLFHTLGLSTSIDLGKLAEVGEWVSREVSRSNESRAGKASLARLKTKVKD